MATNPFEFSNITNIAVEKVKILQLTCAKSSKYSKVTKPLKKFKFYKTVEKFKNYKTVKAFKKPILN